MTTTDNITVKEAIASKIPFKGKVAIVSRTADSFYYSNPDLSNNERPWMNRNTGQPITVHIGSVVMILDHDSKYNHISSYGDVKVLHNGRIAFLPSGLLKITKIEDVFKGKTFCITGALSKPREYYKTFIQMKGGKFKPSLSSKVDYLILGEQTVIQGPSNKQKKAEQSGIPVITENQFFKMFDQKENDGQRSGDKL